MTRHAWLLVPLLLAGLAGCNDDDPGTVRRGAVADGDASGLPAPEGAVGSVTGMPDNPGPGTVALDPAAPAAAIAPPADATFAAGDDGGLDAMAVDTDFPGIEAGRDDAAEASARVAPVIIVPDAAAPPAPAAAPVADATPTDVPRTDVPPTDATASTTFVTEVGPEGAASNPADDARPADADD